LKQKLVSWREQHHRRTGPCYWLQYAEPTKWFSIPRTY